MSSIDFTLWQCHDDRPALAIENSIQRTLGFAGVHDYDVLDWICEAFPSDASEISDVNTHFENVEGLWAVVDGALESTPPDSAQWYKIRHIEETELGFTAKFDKTGNEGGFLFMVDDSYQGYIVWWTGANVGVSAISSTTETVICSLPCTLTGASSVTVAIYPRMYSKVDEIDDIAVSLWFDGQMLLTYMISFADSTAKDAAIARKKIGFAVRGSTATYDNLRIPQLHQIQEWTSVDPGEAASAGMNRVIGQDNIRVQARYDTAVKIWRNTDTTIDWAVPLNRPIQASKRHTHYSPSHVRMVGAVYEVDTFRDGLNQGHIFAVGQDPNAIMEDETYGKGVRRHREIEEEADKLVFILAPNPILEPGDVLSYNSESWRVDGISYKIAMQSSPTGAGQAPVLASSVTCRKLLTS